MAESGNKRFLGVELVPGVLRRNMLVYLFAVFISSGYAGAMSILQPGLLQVMGIPFDQQAQLTGMLGALQEAIFIVMMAVYGALADKFSRRYVYSFGLLLTAIGFALYGTSTTVTELVIYRVIVAFGSAAMVGMMVTVVADYSENRTRGKANGMQGIVATFGAFIPPILASLPAGFVGSGMDEQAAQQATFAVAGSMGIVAAVVAFFGLSKVAGTVADAAKEPIINMLKKGAAAAKESGVALSYGAAFISRGDLAVTGAFMGLWLVQHGTGVLNMSPSDAMNQLAVPAIVMVVLGALIGSGLMGFISDKVSRVRAVTLASGLAALVYGGMYFVTDPTDDWVKGLLFVMGIAEISAFVSSQALVGERAPANQRGSVIGFFGVAGAIGILVGTAGGGALFAEFGPSTPFVLFGFLNFVVFAWSWFVNPNRAEAQNEQTESMQAQQG